VVIHSRDAEDDTIEMLSKHVTAWPGDPDRAGVLHCFTGGPPFAERLAGIGFYVSMSGIATFRNADSIRAAARIVPDDRLVLETDSPLIAPVPHRGKRNEPAYLVHVARTVAGVRGVSTPALAELTRRNAERLFGMGPHG
jgi:TatD DNase family protein